MEIELKKTQQKKKISVLGSTGSIGKSTLDLVKRSPDLFQVKTLTAHSNHALLAKQAIEHQAAYAVIADEDQYLELKKALTGFRIEVAAGTEALIDAAHREFDFLMAGIVGTAGLLPTLEAVKSGKTVGLANKECLVSAGEIFLKEVEAYKTKLIPVDSEHSAIFQVFNFDQIKEVRRIILTASGGPFRQSTAAEMKNITCQQATTHPNWEMGAKISVDSSTMMNKGLELIEAYHLFPVKEDRIEILIHPESIIHSMVDYVDGSVLAQLATTDMRIPISYALSWPNRIKTPTPKLRLEEIGQLSFESPDPGKFPALRIARECLQEGGNASTILNAANEIAVGAFLEEKIDFLKIIQIVENTLENLKQTSIDSIQDVLEIDLEARIFAKNLIAN